MLVYVITRAALIDITHDEAYSFYNMKKFWYAEALCTGNTHWLNSLAIKCAILLKQESLLAIRWFSVLASTVFFTLTFLWIKSTKEVHAKLLIFSVLLLNPYILDYFSVARGYASGLMFEAVALILFFRAIKSNKARLQFFSILNAGLSPLCNFSYIYFFMAFAIIYFIQFYFKEGSGFLKNLKFYRDVLYSLIISGIVVRAFMFMTKCSNDVVGAGTDNFTEYFHVFTDGLIYRKFPLSVTQLNMLSWLTFIMIVFSIAYGIRYRKKHGNIIYLYCSYLLGIIIAVSFINHFCFKLVFPYYRSAVFIFPLTSVCFIFLMLEIVKKKILVYLISLLLTLNFIFSINFKSIFDFYIQANLKESFDFVEKLKAQHVGISPELYGGYRNYYQMTWKYHYNFFGEPIHTNLPKGLSKNADRIKEFDYIILFPPYDMSYYHNNKASFKALKIFRETGTLILKVED